MTQEQAATAERHGPSVREYFDRVGTELGRLIAALTPSDEVRAHFRAARVEVLKGLRAVIDERIDRATQDRSKGKSVTIE